MKKKNVYLIILLGLVGLFVPKETFALDLRYIPYIDYRFYVEDKDRNDVEGLKFKIHDINNKISFESNYDSESKTYNFIEWTPEYINPSYIESEPKFPSGILPEELTTELENYNPTDYNDWYYNKMAELIEKYPSVDKANNYTPFLQISIPMILEETSGKYEEPIKKIIFAKLLFYPYGNGVYQSSFVINNNNCDYLSKVVIDAYEKEWYNMEQLPIINSIRRNAFDYSEDVLNKFAGGNFTSPEMNSNNYQNRCSNRITSAEIASEEINTDLTKEGREEKRIADYCECLPLYIQPRKDPITINPATWNTGFVVLFLSMIFVTGSCFVLIKKRS